MAVNPNASLENRNSIYLGTSGAGKSQCVKQNVEIPTSGVRLFLYDPNQDHKASHYQSQKQFGKVALAALRSGKGFRVSYSGGFDEDDHEWFCKFIYSILDGNKLTYVIDEELGASSSRSGRAAKHHGRLMNQGRKYGLRYHGVVQFPTEVPKTVYYNCWVKYFGMLESEVAEKVSKYIGLPWEQIANLEPLSFWRKDPSIGKEPQLIRFEYKENV